MSLCAWWPFFFFLSQKTVLFKIYFKSLVYSKQNAVVLKFEIVSDIKPSVTPVFTALILLLFFQIIKIKKNFKKLYGPFLWMGFICLKATATSRRQFTFYHSLPRNSWYSFYQPQKDERLSRTWSHPVVLNTGLLDWEFSTLTTGPLLHKYVNAVVSLLPIFPFPYSHKCPCG